MFTDGYADQFGGVNGKKFMSGKFKKLLLDSCEQPVCDIHTKIIQTFTDWKLEEEQIDDVCVLMFKI